MSAQESRDTQRREAIKGLGKAKYNTVARERRVVGWLSGRSREVFAVVSVLLVALGFGLASARPAAADSWPVVSKEMTISPRESQADTGIDLKVGDQLIVEANGWIDPDGHLWPWDPDIGPDGIADGRCYSSFPKPCAPRYSLLGKLAGPGYFFLGSNYNGSPWMTGTEQRLYLGVNDERLGDNAGIFSVRITVYRPLPDTTIESGPSGTVDTRSASFSFSSSKPGSTFECSLDYAAFGSCSSPKYYEGLSDGEHDFGVRAIDVDGHTGPTTWREWTVSVPPLADNTAPTVSLTAPANGTSVRGTLPLKATASDNVGVKEVRFFVNGSQVGTADTTAPYEVSWNSATVSNGSKTITARAFDAAGNQTTSASRTVTVDNTKPTVKSLVATNRTSTGVPLRNTNFKATFSERMTNTTLNKYTFKLYKCTSSACSTTPTSATVTPSTDGLSATLNPYGTSSTMLAANTKYKVEVTTGAKDLAGNALDQFPSTTGNQPKVSYFTTGSG